MPGGTNPGGPDDPAQRPPSVVVLPTVRADQPGSLVSTRPAARPGAGTAAATGPTTARWADEIASDWGGLEAFALDLHAHPELAFEERRSVAALTGELRRAGFDVQQRRRRRSGRQLAGLGNGLAGRLDEYDRPEDHAQCHQNQGPNESLFEQVIQAEIFAPATESAGKTAPTV